MRLFAELNYTMYERMWGPNEFTVIGTHRTTTDRHLGELAVPAAVPVAVRHDEERGRRSMRGTKEPRARCRS